MFPTQADFHFHLSFNVPKWYKGKTGLTTVSVDELVNAHAGIRIPLYIQNTLSLFRLWQGNRKREGANASPKAFALYIATSGPGNQEKRWHYCNRILRKLDKLNRPC